GVGLLMMVAGPVFAQQPTAPPRDTSRVGRPAPAPSAAPNGTPADSTQNPRPDPGHAIPPPDTTAHALADSLNPDSTRAILPSATPLGPRPPSTRVIFDGDALRWSGAI